MATTKTNATADRLGSLASEQAPVLETITRMHLDTLDLCSLDVRGYYLARLGALVAMGAPPASFMTYVAMAADAGITAEDAEGVLVAVAPITGAPRVTEAAGNILRGLGLGAALEEAMGDGAEKK